VTPPDARAPNGRTGLCGLRKALAQMAPMTASQLRQNIYRTLDQIIETGVPLEIERKGAILRIVPEAPRRKLANLKRRDGYLLCDPEDLVDLDWSHEWQP
jgi:hypothetical protein